MSMFAVSLENRLQVETHKDMSMNKEQHKLHKKKRRAHRTRAQISGTADRPRLSVHRTLHHISAQLIDDAAGTTLAFADDSDVTGTKVERAIEVGKRIATAAGAKKITAAVFDRGSARFHGRVKALADSAREGGLKF